MASFDHIVIGAGIVGSCTALHLARKGRKVLLLEQFDVLHSKGSSHGETRIIRSAYADEFFAKMMLETWPLWKELETLGETKLIEKTGLLSLGRKPCQEVEDTLKNLRKYASNDVEVLDIQDRQIKFPVFNYGEDYDSVYDNTAGVILAAKTMATVQKLFCNYGGTLQANCKVTSIEPGPVVTVRTTRGDYQAPSIIICAGSWTNKILSHLNINIPLKPVRVTVCYWKEKEAGSHSIQNKFPTFMDFENSFYGLPSVEKPGYVKICNHRGEAVDPDLPINAETEENVEENKILKDFVSKHFPGLIPVIQLKETCIYSMTPDEFFILDNHPKYKNIIIGAGFSGTGFKFGPLVGKILGDMSMGQQVSHDLKSFSLSRFSKD